MPLEVLHVDHSMELSLDLLERQPAELSCRAAPRDSGSAVQFTDVELISIDSQVTAVRGLSASGLVDFGPVPPGRYRLRVEGHAAGTEGRWAHEFKEELLLLSGDRPVRELDVPFVSRELEVRTELDDGPLADTWVSLTRLDTERPAVLHSHTDADGRLRLVLPTGVYALTWKGEAPEANNSARVEWRADGDAFETVVLPL